MKCWFYLCCWLKLTSPLEFKIYSSYVNFVYINDLLVTLFPKKWCQTIICESKEVHHRTTQKGIKKRLLSPSKCPCLFSYIYEVGNQRIMWSMWWLKRKKKDYKRRKHTKSIKTLENLNKHKNMTAERKVKYDFEKGFWHVKCWE